jgi:carboxypeptidase family protein
MIGDLCNLAIARLKDKRSKLGKFKKLLVLSAITLLEVFASGPSAAQSRVVRGVVTDEAGAAISKTSVEITCRQKGHVTKVGSTQSGTTGDFQLEAILHGACKINFSSVGFKRLQIPIRASDNRPVLELGAIRLRVAGCSDPGVICDGLGSVKPEARRFPLTKTSHKTPDS